MDDCEKEIIFAEEQLFSCQQSFKHYPSVRCSPCSGLNFQDLMVRLGAIDSPPKTPVILGLECAGEVEAVGEGVEDFKVSERAKKKRENSQIRIHFRVSPIEMSLNSSPCLLGW